MKLIRFGDAGIEQPGLLLANDAARDCSGWFADWDGRFFEDGGLEALRARSGEWAALPDVPEGARMGPPIVRPWKVLCVGPNYSDHAEESGMKPPEEPVLFCQTGNTVVGPLDDVFIPPGSEKTDWEVELGIVIGKAARRLASPESAADHIAGYCVSHDVSERTYQLERCGQWVKGKACALFLIDPNELFSQPLTS